MRIIITAVICCSVLLAKGQFTFFSPKEAFAIEVSMENTDLVRLPIYQNSISSLAVMKNIIVGGTSAEDKLSPYIFTASLDKREMISAIDLNKVVPQQKALKAGFCKVNSGHYYSATMPADKSEGGHLLEIKIDGNGQINVKDIGIPMKDQGIFTMIINKEKNKLYGISYPSGNFFSYDIGTKQTVVYTETAVTRKTLNQIHEYSLTPDDYLCKSLIEDNNGVIYGSMPVNKLFYFEPAKKKFSFFADIPEVWGRRILGRVETWAKSRDGKLYGGNSGDGQLFVVDPASKKVKNLGKPIMMNHLKGLAFGGNGKLYGVGGGAPGYAHLFSYDQSEGYKDFGNPQFTMVAPGIEQGIDWRGFQIGTVAASEDGKYIVMGEDEALSQLLVFPAGAK
jgi:hypothetical protein